ncbi:3-keto-disaccharide hydrolase [Marinimicrobium sp. C2-29]|uniref:3-keto-disaccharide hydrolase n=1 Tax=Marinimicrobium sp. C2-29 TaxID=3139825 RepID=UPI00313A240A
MRWTQHLLSIGLAAAVITGCNSQPGPDHNADQEEWVELFNGEDLDDWIIKIAGHPPGENALNTFRLEDGKIVVSYDQYDELDGRWGHIFYKEPFSHYRIEVEYRFVGEQVAGAPEWAIRNNGIMYHAQSPHQMELDQGYPACMEVQLLGGNGEDERPTSNLVTPGTHAVYEGELREDHIIESTSETYHGNQWVTAEVEVHGNELAIHRVEGEEVIRYSGMQLDDGTPLHEGYIALQAESAPIEFRSVRLLNLEGCMDESASNYKSYFVAHDPDACTD